MHTKIVSTIRRFFPSPSFRNSIVRQSRQGDTLFSIDQFLLFSGMVKVSGWIWDPQRTLVRLSLQIPREGELVVANIHLPSGDVASVIDPRAVRTRFIGHWLSNSSAAKVVNASLLATFDDGSEFAIDHLGTRDLGHEPHHKLMHAFVSMLSDNAQGALLEIGSRARSGISRRQLIPAGWSYTGLDIMAGVNRPGFVGGSNS